MFINPPPHHDRFSQQPVKLLIKAVGNMLIASFLHVERISKLHKLIKIILSLTHCLSLSLYLSGSLC